MRLPKWLWLLVLALHAGCSSAPTEPIDTNQAVKSPEVAAVTQEATPNPTPNDRVIENDPQAVKTEQHDSPAPARQLPEIFAADLKHTPDYAYAVAVMRPAKMSRLEGVQGIPGADLAGPLPVKPSEIERVVATVYPLPNDRGGSLGFGFVVQLRTDINRGAIVSWINPRAAPFPQDNRIYASPDWNAGDLLLGFMDDGMIVISSDPNFVFSRFPAATDPVKRPHSLASAFADLDRDADVAAVVDMDRLGHFVRPEFLETATSLMRLFEQFESLRFADVMKLSLNLSKPSGLALRGEGNREDDFDGLGKFANETLALRTADLIASFHEVLGTDFAERIRTVDKQISQILQTATLRHDENSYTIESRQLPPAAETLKLVANIGALQVARMQREQMDLQTRYNLTNVGLAFHNYHATYRALPRDIASQDGKPLLSWRVTILPFIGQTPLHERFHLDEPWDSEHNLKLLNDMPDIYRSRGGQEPMKTSFQWVTGEGTAGSAKSFKEIKGMDKTLALVESNKLVEWTRPADFVFDPNDVTNGLRQHGSFALMHDGSRAYLSPDTDHALLRSAFLNDGSSLDLEALNGGIPRPHYEVAPDPVLLGADEFKDTLAALESDDVTAVLEALRRLLRSHPDVRAKFVVQSVTPLLKSKSPLVRLEALWTIEYWNAAGAVDWQAMAELLKDPYEANRWLAIRMLAESPKPELVEAMLRLPPQDLQVAFRVLYEDYANIAADAAVPLLADKDFMVRARAAQLIGGTGNESHIVELRKLLDDDHESCRGAAKGSLAFLEKKGPLEEALEEFNGDIAAALKKVAKFVTLDEDGYVVGIDLDHHATQFRLTNNDFPLLGKLPRLKRLELTYSAITAKGVTHLADLPLEALHINYCPRLDDTVADSLRRITSLRVLHLDKTKVGDETAKAVGQLKDLRELDMSYAQISNVGVMHLKNLTQLEDLNLSYTQISDEALSAIASHAKLRRLYLLGTRITNAGVEQLCTLKNLEFMNLSGSGVTRDGYARLREALPHCGGLDLE